MKNHKTPAVSASFPFPDAFRPPGWLRTLRRIWRIYLETPFGCEITAEWIIDRSVRRQKTK